MPERVKVCVDCGEEYRLEAVRCADCGGELEERMLDESGELIQPESFEAEASSVPSDPVEALPGAVMVENQRVVFVTPRAAELVPLAEALRESEIPYRLAESAPKAEGAPPQYSLLVTEEHAPAALETLAPLLAPEGDADLGGIEAGFSPDQGYLRCPACGAVATPGATECAECGLRLSSGEEG